MGRRGGLLLVLLGVVLAGAAGVGVYREAQAARAYRPPTALVVVALQEIPGNSIITPPTLGTKEMLLTSIPPGAVATANDAVGKMTTENVHLGEVLLKEQLADTEGQSGFAYELKPGEVAISIPAADIIDTGAVRIGDHVDMLITLEPPAQQSGPQPAPAGVTLPATSQTALQDLRVLAIGSVGAPSKGAAPTGSQVIFGVSHEDALYLKALKDASNVKAELVLRAAGDDKVAQTKPVNLQSIIDRFNLRGN
ncbi:MAG TPA: Flp pilus assembly protein CpaB [Chloroflexota bacterium]|nr:Flp pilus assembly protein CpaB [Chloroflexota bacterium]